MTIKLIFISALCTFLLSCSSSPKNDLPAAPTEPSIDNTPKASTSPWGYSGLNSPENWGHLSPQYTACKEGKMQSPINLVWSRPAGSPDISFSYKPSEAQVTDTGNTILINVAPGNVATIRGESYELKGITFHSSSEHTLSGNSLPLEIHYFHIAASGKVAVVSFFAIEGPRSPMVDVLWSNIPRQKNIEQVMSKKINPMDLMPKKFNHYNYTGSLTTPPCTENVDWNVLNTPITLSRDQILSFRQLYPHNNRPIQPTNGRSITNY